MKNYKYFFIVLLIVALFADKSSAEDKTIMGDNTNAVTFQGVLSSRDNAIILIDRETITFELFRPCMVTLDIYNHLGIKLKSLIHNRNMSNGKHKIRITQNELCSGTYLLHAKIGKNSFNKKLFLIK